MSAILTTAGESLSVDSELPWVTDLLAEGAGGELCPGDRGSASVRVQVEAARRSFDVDGWELLTRGAWRRGNEVVVHNACTTGFDLHAVATALGAELTFRWRPPARDRVAARVLRSRFHLLTRALMTQYPALWWSGTSLRAPLHASACTAGRATPLLVAAGGIGRSTVIAHMLEAGGRATGEDLAVGDGITLWGLVEPLRLEGGAGRLMPHGRREVEMRDRADALVPDSVIVLERGGDGAATLEPCDPQHAARSLVTATYMAGALRRYWSFAATLAAGTGAGPGHQLVTDVAAGFAGSLPCYVLTLGRLSGDGLSPLLDALEIAA